MTENNDKINQLLEKLNALSNKQQSFSKEINELREEIYKLNASEGKEPLVEKKEIKITQPVVNNPDLDFDYDFEAESKIENETPIYASVREKISPQVKSNMEKFIGENLINKIGIAIIVIGVAIGAKYSIDHELISPLTRIILGYLTGLGLLGFGIKLKKNYESYSAVLVSGTIAIWYFITYAAYGFYDLLPQPVAFGMMVVFTAFAVVAAINYNRQVIAHIGLVGAYAVPFLLSEGSGKVAVLFSYMAIINIGILFIAFKKYWKPLYYASFALTWLVFAAWYNTKYDGSEHLRMALIFLSVFFVTFYLIFLAYKLLQKEKFELEDIILLLANSFIFYSIGYSIFNSTPTGQQLLGLFTLCNALIHFVTGLIIYKQKLADRNLFFLVAGLALVFVTIAIPVQLDGNWVTLLWTGEATLLFWIGRTKNVSVYETLSYPLMFLAFFSLEQDWLTVYNVYDPEHPETRLIPLLNINFLTSVLFIGSFVFINYINNSKQYISSSLSLKGFNSFISIAVPAILIIVLYYSFSMEISAYWNQSYLDSAIKIKKTGQEYPDAFNNYDLKQFENIWIINYSLLFFSLLSLANIKKIKNRNLGLVNIALNTLVVVVFLTQGLYILSELRESYLNQTLAEYYQRTSFNIVIRYISYGFVALMLTAIYKYIHQEFLKPTAFNLKVGFDLLLYISVLWMASSELINWMDIMKSSQSYKLGLSILWGIYSLSLIVLGIWKKKKHIRIGAIALFAVTLIKLFFYDISDLNTIAKTIVFVLLGILLLIISFLYNKYKHLISEENEG